MKEVKVKIPNEISDYVEMLFFEYNQEMKILSYLAAQPNTKKEHLDAYYAEAKEKGVALEMAKENAKEQYRPCEADKIMCYQFDFINGEIIFRINED